MEHTITKEQMDSIKILADTNIKISEAKNLLFKLEETETEYLEAREKKAIARIQQAVEESQELIKQIKENHSAVKEFSRNVDEVSKFLSEVQASFVSLLEDFNKRSDAWDKEYEKQYAELDNIRQSLATERVLIENDKKTNKKEFEEIGKAKILIESRQAQIKSALEVLKNKQNG